MADESIWNSSKWNMHPRPRCWRMPQATTSAAAAHVQLVAPAEAPRQAAGAAGGLNPENVGGAIAEVRPYAVDVSSGVEHSPGIKSTTKMKSFVDAVRRADQRA